jgi:hypothetical protein
MKRKPLSNTNTQVPQLKVTQSFPVTGTSRVGLMRVGVLPEHANPEAEADQKHGKEDHGCIGRDPQGNPSCWFGHAVIPAAI